MNAGGNSVSAELDENADPIPGLMSWEEIFFHEDAASDLLARANEGERIPLREVEIATEALQLCTSDLLAGSSSSTGRRQDRIRANLTYAMGLSTQLEKLHEKLSLPCSERWTPGEHWGGTSYEEDPPEGIEPQEDD